MPKRKVNCPNPLFVQWLEEWKQEAEERGLNSKWTYAKAISSIKKYPLPLRSGREARILENIGNGIADKLDQRLHEYLQNGGDLTDLHRLQESPVKQRKNKNPDTSSNVTTDLNDQKNVDVAAFSPLANYKKTNTRQYIPKFRSGAYALIITLYQECQKPTYLGYIGKSELQEKAQHLCDTSMTMHDAGSHYTAWSSMGTLIEKGYIIKKSSPAKYYITYEGCELAHKLLDGTLVKTPTPKKKRVSNQNNKAQNNLRNDQTFNRQRSQLPEAGAGLLMELQDLVAQLDHRESKDKAGGYDKNNTIKSINHPQNFPQWNISSPMHSPEHTDTHLKSPNRNTELFTSVGNKLGGSARKDRMAFFNKLQEEINKNSTAKKPSSHTITRPVVAAGKELLEANLKAFAVNQGELDSESNIKAAASTPCVGTTEIHGPAKRLDYVYITEDGSMTSSKSKALVTINDSLGLGFLIKTVKDDLQMSDISHVIDKARCSSSEFIYAYIADEDAKETSMTPEAFALKMTSKGSPRVLVANQNNESACVRPVSKQSVCDLTQTEVSSRKVSSESMTHKNEYEKVIAADNGGSNTNRLYGKSTDVLLMTKSTKLAVDDSHQQNPISNSTDITEKNDASKPSQIPLDIGKETLFTLRPGTFDVTLCVDVVETTGTGRRKKELADKLSKSGLNMEVRKLQVGDFVWIAKERFGERREVVLDFIIERKRMDDLASSICDGRFKEQKFRLKCSYLKKPIYLVEQYGSPDHYPVPEATLRQAIMNTQVIEGFFVKETADIYDSADYLKIMTRQLTKSYSNKTLHALTYDTVKGLHQDQNVDEFFLQSPDQYLMTFQEFTANCDKNKMLTVSEMFSKHLMQLKGVSAERAMALVEKYPTPLLFVSALGNCSTLSEKENLVANIEFGKSKRKIGAAISKQIQLAYDTLKNMT